MMPVKKIVNATDVLPPSLVKLIQQKLEGQGVLLYFPAVAGRRGIPETLQTVMALTGEGMSAAAIARRLEMTVRHVYRLRQQAREHPELLIPKPKRRKMTRTTPEERRQRAVEADQRRRERLAAKRQKAEDARMRAVFGEDILAVREIPRVRPVLVDESR